MGEGCGHLGYEHEFTNVVVRSYQHVKYLSMPKNGATITNIANIEEVVKDELSEQHQTAKGANIIGVLSLDTYLGSCYAKQNFTQPPPLWELARSVT